MSEEKKRTLLRGKCGKKKNNLWKYVNMTHGTKSLVLATWSYRPDTMGKKVMSVSGSPYGDWCN